MLILEAYTQASTFIGDFMRVKPCLHSREEGSNASKFAQNPSEGVYPKWKNTSETNLASVNDVSWIVLYDVCKYPVGSMR